MGHLTRVFACMGLLLLVGCGGGGGSPVQNVSSSTANVTVTVTPGTPTVGAGNTQAFAATVIGTAFTGVTWSVNGVVNGNATVGIISTAGVYVAPAALPSPNTVTITATSQIDATRSG